MTPQQIQARVQAAHVQAETMLALLGVHECFEIAATLLGGLAARMPADVAPGSDLGRIQEASQQAIDALMRTMRSGIVVAPPGAVPVNGHGLRAVKS